MSGWQVVLLVLGILLLQVGIWIPLLVWLRRRTRGIAALLQAELSAAGERPALGPEPASYRGGTAEYPRVKGNAVLALTDRRLACRKLVGKSIDIPLETIADVREDKWFLGTHRGGRLHLILRRSDGAEVGFQVRDHARWMTAVREALVRARST